LCIDQANRRTPDSCVNQEYKNFGWIEFNQSQKRAVSQNFDSVLLLSVDGYITEGPGFGVCFVKDNTVITPQKDCLRSVTIKVVEDICKQQNIKFLRKDISVLEAHASTECFICSTSGGITFVDKLDNIQFTHNISSIIKRHYESF
jgi:branched-chain amino acid aminotransferase